MKIGIYGGAFNPVHNGHLHLAHAYQEAEQLDRILFVPTANPPHKSNADFASRADRVNMLRLALEKDSAFEISEIEFLRQEKSYTYDTICALRALYPQDHFYLIVGADQFFAFDQWYKAEEILSMVTLLSAPRLDEEERRRMVQVKNTMPVFQGADVHLADISVLPMSSDEIRTRIQAGAPIDGCVPKKVCEYIYRKGLYNV